MIRFATAADDLEHIQSISLRAKLLARESGIKIDARELQMDISACHANGCPLKLAELAKADTFAFIHDVFGIRSHINRRTGKLEDCFLPRYAKH